MHAFQHPEYINLESYAVLLDTQVSQEGFDAVTNIPNYILSKLDHVVGFFTSESDIIKEQADPKANVYYKKLIDNKYKLKTTEVDFSLAKRRKVNTIPHIGVDIPTLTNELLNATMLIEKTRDNFYKETLEHIAKLCNDDNYRLSSRPIKLNPEFKKTIDAIHQAKVNIVEPKEIKTLKYVKDLVPTLPHLVESLEEATQYGKYASNDTYKALIKQVDQIKVYSETLYKQLKQDKNIKKERIVEVAKYIDHIAQYTTYVADIYFLDTQSLILLNDTVETILK